MSSSNSPFQGRDSPREVRRLSCPSLTRMTTMINVSYLNQLIYVIPVHPVTVFDPVNRESQGYILLRLVILCRLWFSYTLGL